MRAGLVAVIVVVLTACGSSSAPEVVLPPAGAVIDYQLGAAYPPAPEAAIVVRDRAAQAANDRYGICYVNAFQTQPDELAGWSHDHPDLLLRDSTGQPVQDPDWPGEQLFDLRTASSRAHLLQIVGPWIDGCAENGYEAVEPDNLDSWTRSQGLLSRKHAEAFARLLTERAHASGLAVAQKNSAELSSTDLGFDFAVAEECEVHDECMAYTAAFGDHVIEIEYTDNGAQAFTRACALRGDRVSVLLRDREVVGPDNPEYVSRWC